MNVDPSSYTSYYNGKKAFEYDADKQDIWMVPLGVSFRNETKTGSGWRITPKLDVAYIWAFGDTDNEVDVNMAGASAPLYYTVMDDGSWLASLGVDASHGAWTFGAGYAYQKGDDTKNNNGMSTLALPSNFISLHYETASFSEDAVFILCMCFEYAMMKAVHMMERNRTCQEGYTWIERI